MIARLELKNFTAFSNLAIDFSPKVNVIIGENGTGKTHLLKAAYAVCSCSSLFNENSKMGKNKIREALTAKLLRLFMPLDNKLSRMYHRGSSESARLEVRFASDTKVTVSFSANSKSIVLEESENYGHYHDKPVFIPTKEVLSFIKGISSSNSDPGTVQNIFDDTYLDLCTSLLTTTTPDEEARLALDPRFGSIFPKIVKAIGGRYEFADGKFCFQQGVFEERRAKKQHKFGDKIETIFTSVKNSELSNNMTAEGFRKIGVLQQLLANGAINPGISGPLFWDEPEANMNPKLMRLLVEILLELSRNGQQIILTTHDYVLLRWFDLLMDKNKDDHVSYHSLYRDQETGSLKIHSTDEYLAIEPNSIDDAFEALINSDLDQIMGDLGK